MREKSPSWMSGALPGALGQRLRRIAGWAIAGTLGAGAGCGPVKTNIIELPSGMGGAAGQAAPAPKQPVLSCGAQQPSDFPFLLTRSVDYLAVYVHPGILLSHYGSACRDAPDATSCADALMRAAGQSQACHSAPTACASFVVTTRAGEVERHDTIEALVSLFGEIDTKAEAAVVAGFTYRFGYCGLLVVTPTTVGYRVETQREQACGALVRETVQVHRDGRTSGFAVLSNPALQTCLGPVPGRRTAGLELQSREVEMPALGSFFSHMAQLEAASVPAFTRLHGELARLGAPDALLRACTRSARDELRHAQLMAALAARHGARVVTPHVHAPRSGRSRFEVALENAREGCIRESFAALLALHQAGTARDALVKQVMTSIAADEARHAELAHHVADWLTPQLYAHEQHIIARARAETLRALAREIDREILPDDIREHVGWPSRTTQHSLLNGLASALHRC